MAGPVQYIAGGPFVLANLRIAYCTRMIGSIYCQSSCLSCSHAKVIHHILLNVAGGARFWVPSLRLRSEICVTFDVESTLVHLLPGFWSISEMNCCGGVLGARCESYFTLKDVCDLFELIVYLLFKRVGTF